MGEGRALQTSNYFSVAKENVNRRSALAWTLCFISSSFFFSFAGWVELGRLNCVLFLLPGFPSSCPPSDRGNAAAVTETGNAWQLQLQPSWHLEKPCPTGPTHQSAAQSLTWGFSLRSEGVE